MTVVEIIHDATAATATGRSRNAAATRQAILHAASIRFRCEGYDAVGIRDIARDARCDPALVSRYFGGKEELFRQVISACGDKGACLTETAHENFGAHYARQLVYDPSDSDGMELVLIMLRASGSAKAAEMVRRVVVQDLLQPFAAWIGGEQAEVRAKLAASLIMGFALNRSLTADTGVPEADRDAMYERLADLLQRCVD